MSTGLVKATTGGLAAWKPKEDRVNPPAVLAEGMGILSEAYSKNFTPAGVMAYDLVTSHYKPEDFRAGVRKLLATVKFPTPAALVECIDEVIRERHRAEQAIKDEENREEYRRAYRAREDEIARHAAEVAGFPTLGPPSTREELVRRALVVADATRVGSWVEYCVGRAEVSDDLASVVIPVFGAEPHKQPVFERLFAQAMGRSITVILRDERHA